MYPETDHRQFRDDDDDDSDDYYYDDDDDIDEAADMYDYFFDDGEDNDDDDGGFYYDDVDEELLESEDYGENLTMRDGKEYYVDADGNEHEFSTCDERTIYGPSAIYNDCGWVITGACTHM